MNARKRPIPIAAEQIVRSPTKCRGNGAKGAIKKMANVIHKPLPSAQRHVTGRPVGVEPRETFRPSAGNAAVVLDDGNSLMLDLAPNREGAIGGNGHRHDLGKRGL